MNESRSCANDYTESPDKPDDLSTRAWLVNYVCYPANSLIIPSTSVVKDQIGGVRGVRFACSSLSAARTELSANGRGYPPGVPRQNVLKIPGRSRAAREMLKSIEDHAIGFMPGVVSVPWVPGQLT